MTRKTISLSIAAMVAVSLTVIGSVIWQRHHSNNARYELGAIPSAGSQAVAEHPENRAFPANVEIPPVARKLDSSSIDLPNPESASTRVVLDGELHPKVLAVLNARREIIWHVSLLTKPIATKSEAIEVGNWLATCFRPNSGNTVSQIMIHCYYASDLAEADRTVLVGSHLFPHSSLRIRWVNDGDPLGGSTLVAGILAKSDDPIDLFAAWMDGTLLKDEIDKGKSYFDAANGTAHIVWKLYRSNEATYGKNAGWSSLSQSLMYLLRHQGIPLKLSDRIQFANVVFTNAKDQHPIAKVQVSRSDLIEYRLVMEQMESERDEIVALESRLFWDACDRKASMKEFDENDRTIARAYLEWETRLWRRTAYLFDVTYFDDSFAPPRNQ